MGFTPLFSEKRKEKANARPSTIISLVKLNILIRTIIHTVGFGMIRQRIGFKLYYQDLHVFNN